MCNRSLSRELQSEINPMQTAKLIPRKDEVPMAGIEFRYADDNIKVKTFGFDALGKLLWSDLFALNCQQQGA